MVTEALEKRSDKSVAAVAPPVLLETVFEDGAGAKKSKSSVKTAAAVGAAAFCPCVDFPAVDEKASVA